MAQPFLWGSPIGLPAGINDYDVLALRNGTFLVFGKADTTLLTPLKACIYNADGSIKEERIIDSPAFGSPFGDLPLTNRALNPFATELPDGRIAFTWTIASRSPGHFGAWLGIYGSDLQPLVKPYPIAGLGGGPLGTSGHFKADDAIGLADGSVAAVFRSTDGKAFLRVLSRDGILSETLALGPTLASGDEDGFESVADLAVLPDGKVVAVLRTSGTENTVYVLDPSAAGGPAVVKSFTIPVVASSSMMPIEVTALEGGRFVVTWTENGELSASGSEPIVTVRYQIFTAEGTEVTNPLSFYATVAEAEAVGTPDIVALPGGGFALAAQVVTDPLLSTSEVRLAIFDAAGARVSDKLLVSQPMTGSLISLEGLSLMADGRIAALMSNGIQIIDPRDKAVSLKGTAGNDHYIGTAFNDTFEDSAGADILNGGNGFDYVSFAHASAGVIASLSGGSGGDAAGDTYISIEGLVGSSFTDVFFGNGSAVLKGGLGDDTYHVRTEDMIEEAVNGGRDTIIVGGSYKLAADAQIEALKLSGLSSKKSANLTGSNIGNEIRGHSGVNTLKGQGGNDKLYGGYGNDKLYGGSGKDIFVFDTKPNKKSNVDRIYDFDPKYDSIHLENKIFTKLGKGSAAGMKFKSDMFVKGPHARDREDRIIYDSKTGALYYDKDGTGSAAQIKIATLNKNLKLTYKDFFII
ncbi:calcium-binding protein [Microvirga sp. ACRRW]|uniref:calcium-binding protein n=1 Tax=Microvirga sp. ACRRW TaxID=2918205 RepID=UPI0027298395|nr:calcium-binding protein [Microvirga sp. ACRRW]